MWTAPTGSNFYWCGKHASPPVLEPGSMEYRPRALATANDINHFGELDS